MSYPTDEGIKKILKEEQAKARFIMSEPDGKKVGFSFARVTPEDVDYYRNLEFSELLKEYLGLYFIVYIYGLSSVKDYQKLQLMEREVYEFRSKSEQEEFERKVKELNDEDHSALYKELRGE